MSEARDPEGRLVENILHFTQALRKAGVKVGTAQVETAIEAVAAAGFTKSGRFLPHPPGDADHPGRASGGLSPGLRDVLARPGFPVEPDADAVTAA
jgi:hypothetical protein